MIWVLHQLERKFPALDKIKFWRLMIRLGVLVGLAGLLVLALQPDLPVRAEEAARQPLQNNYPAPNPTVGYDPPPDTGITPTLNPYPEGPTNPTNTPPGAATQPPGNTLQPTITRPVGTITQPAFQTPAPGNETPSPTPNLSQTAEMDAFRTEDAEMGGSRNGTVTPPTPEGTPTATLTITASPTEGEVYRAAEANPKDGDGSGFEMNWGLFWIGFSIPVLGACGVVLYLLDRRPEFFRPKRKQRIAE